MKWRVEISRPSPCGQTRCFLFATRQEARDFRRFIGYGRIVKNGGWRWN